MLHAEDVRTVSKTIGLNPIARPAATTWQATVTRDHHDFGRRAARYHARSGASMPCSPGKSTRVPEPAVQAGTVTAATAGTLHWPT
jgi:hypothetical protein